MAITFREMTINSRKTIKYLIVQIDQKLLFYENTILVIARANQVTQRLAWIVQTQTVLNQGNDSFSRVSLIPYYCTEYQHRQNAYC